MSDTDTDLAPTSAGASGRVAPWIAALLAVVLGSLVVVLAINRGAGGDTADSPLLGQPAPDVRGTLAEGGTFDLSRRKGSWVVLNFFSHDCIPCIVEHPDLIEFVDAQRALGTQGAEFYTVVQESSRAEVEQFFAERGGDWPIVYDDEFELQVEFGVAQVPETWVLDPNGTVRARYITTVDAAGLGRDLEAMREGRL